MAAETGLSQSTVNRIWRTYGVQPGARAAVGPRQAWSLPDHAEEVVGLFIAPPVCVLAVTAATGRGRALRTSPATDAGRLFGQDPEASHVLAVACAFAALRGDGQTPGPLDLGAFLQQVGSVAGAGEVVHLLTHGMPAPACEAPDTAVPPRLRWHRPPGPAAWTDEIRRLLAADAHVTGEAAVDPHRLRDALLTWSTTWTPAAAPVTRVAAPRPSYDTPAICGRNNDSNARITRALADPGLPAATRIASSDAPPGAPVTTDPVVGLLREAVLAGGHLPGDRVREAPLAARLGLSRRVVCAGLWALAEEGMLDLLPSGATAVPAVAAKDVLDLYALRASLGALLIRRVAMLGPERLGPASAALAEVRAAARARDHLGIREVDLRFQDALARTADLPQAAGTFERLTARLRMFVTVLDMDCIQACDTILNEDTVVFDALRDADGNEAARLWRVKIERCVRYMIARLPEDDIAPHLWTTLAGRPRPGREEARGAAH
ncbi:GntR family transcriptional regulator [Streptomyces sp. ISL-22]|uniref:GntR family transcriptional regulator n=1 Tax=unclassified Streptomyces TaxID=2593676 RepID=UPI001BE90E90|nr:MULTISPECIES: GntR family transcriptional regulator [unclassified Streptomyces]MBT2417773.1 GntR family transcriptional regulator [Streptomyces sp. ISL-24]MBT2438051.1 GntR family transcriptional regulator [Streptomyces sp. ISL-22]